MDSFQGRRRSVRDMEEAHTHNQILNTAASKDKNSLYIGEKEHQSDQDLTSPESCADGGDVKSADAINITEGNEKFTNHSLFWEGYGSTPKERLRLLLDEPRSSKTAFWVAFLIALLITSSTIATIIETLPQLYHSQHILFWIEASFIAAFTVEFLVRFYAHSSTFRQLGRFLRSPFSILDLITIAPFYIALLISMFTGVSIIPDPHADERPQLSLGWADMQRLTVLRLFRLFRLFRCYTYSSFLQLSIDALLLSLWKSVESLMALLVFMIFVLIAFSTMLYFAERGEWCLEKKIYLNFQQEPSQFSSIPAAAWYVTVVMTTVGLGDMTPKTWLGRLITFPLMFFSLLFIALPSIIVGRNFSECWIWLKRNRPIHPHAMMIPPNRRKKNLLRSDSMFKTQAKDSSIEANTNVDDLSRLKDSRPIHRKSLRKTMLSFRQSCEKNITAEKVTRKGQDKPIIDSKLNSLEKFSPTAQNLEAFKDHIMSDSSLVTSNISRKEALLLILRELRIQNEIMERFLHEEIAEIEDLDEEMRLTETSSFILGSRVNKLQFDPGSNESSE